jgi:hypothetical protein
MVLMHAASLLGALEGVGHENLNFFGPKWHSLRWLPFQGPKSLDFQGPPFPMPQVMMPHALKPLSISPI